MITPLCLLFAVLVTAVQCQGSVYMHAPQQGQVFVGIENELDFDSYVEHCGRLGMWICRLLGNT